MMNKVLLAALTTAVFSLSVNAADWFNGGIATGWPNATTKSGGSWSNAVSSVASYDAGKVILDADAGEQLAFVADSAKALGDKTKEVALKTGLKFVAFDALPDVPADAKASVIVVGTTFYVLADNAGANAWVATGYTTVDVSKSYEVNVKFAKVDSDWKVTYTIKDGDTAVVDTTVAINLPANATISTAAYEGSGEITSLLSTYDLTVVEFTLEAPANASVLKVMADEEELTAPYAVDPGTEITVTYKAADGYLFANGLDTIDKSFTVTTGGAKPAPEGTATTLAPVAIGSKYYLTMSAAVDAVTADQVIVLKQDFTEAVTYTGTASFEIDLNGKIWSYTQDTQEGDAYAAAFKLVDTTKAAVVTIKDSSTSGSGKMYATNYGFCIWAKGGKVVIENGKFYNNSDDDYAIYANANGIVEILDGEFVNENGAPYVWNNKLHNLNLNVAQTLASGIGQGEIIVKGGSFTAEPKDDSGVVLVADGYYAYDKGACWIVSDNAPVATVDGKICETLADAIAAVADDGTIVLARSYVTEETDLVIADKDISLDLAGYTVTFSTTSYIAKLSDSTLTIKDSTADGAGQIVKNSQTTMFQIGAKDHPATINLQKGTIAFTGENDPQTTAAGTCVKVEYGTFNMTGGKVTAGGKDGESAIRVYADGTVTISGGEVVAGAKKDEPHDPFLFDKRGGTITLTGGTYSIEPDASYLAAGYYAWKQNSGKFEVNNTVPAAKIGDQFYVSLDAAIEAAGASDVIKVWKDLTISSFVAKDVTIDANGKVVTFDDVEMDLANDVTFINSGNPVGGVKNYAQVEIAASNTLNLAALSWGNGLIGTFDKTTASFTLNEGAKILMGYDASTWSDSFTNIVTAASGFKVVLTKEDAVATITTDVIPAPPASDPVIPGDKQKSTADTKEDAEASVVIGVDPYAKADLDAKGVEEATYKSYFKGSAEGTAGNWEVTVVLKDEVKEDVQAVVNDEVKAIDLTAAEGVSLTIAAEDVKPGLYYGIAVATSVGGAKDATPVTWTMADANGVTLSADKPAEATSAFYVLKCSPVDTNKKND